MFVYLKEIIENNNHNIGKKMLNNINLCGPYVGNKTMVKKCELEISSSLTVHILPNKYMKLLSSPKKFLFITEQFCYGSRSAILKTEQKYSEPGSISLKFTVISKENVRTTFE